MFDDLEVSTSSVAEIVDMFGVESPLHSCKAYLWLCFAGMIHVCCKL